MSNAARMNRRMDNETDILTADAPPRCAPSGGSDVRPVTVNRCPDCGEKPCLIEGVFRFHVGCENEPCRKPRGRRQANIKMAITSWNWQAEHNELIYDHAERNAE